MYRDDLVKYVFLNKIVLQLSIELNIGEEKLTVEEVGY